MALLFKADGTTQEITPLGGRKFTLEEMQKLVGGFIEMIRLPDTRVLIMDEEGKLKKYPPNAAATAALTGIIQTDDVVVGDVILASSLEAGYNS